MSRTINGAFRKGAINERTRILQRLMFEDEEDCEQKTTIENE